MLIKIKSVPEKCRSLDNVTDIITLTLPSDRTTKTVTNGMEFGNIPCGQEVVINNGTDDDIEKLKQVGIIVEKISTHEK